VAVEAGALVALRPPEWGHDCGCARGRANGHARRRCCDRVSDRAHHRYRCCDRVSDRGRRSCCGRANVHAHCCCSGREDGHAHQHFLESDRVHFRCELA